MLAKKHRAGFFTALVVIITIIIALFGYWQQKSGVIKKNLSYPTPIIDNEKVKVTGILKERSCSGVFYLNKEIGYEVCYPKGWVFKEFGEGKETVGFDQRPIPEATDYLGRFIVSVVNQSLENGLVYFQDNLTDKREEVAKIGTISGKKIEGTISKNAPFFSGQKQTVYLVENNGKTFELLFMDTSDGFVSLLPKFLDFVESFQFITPQPSKIVSPTGNIVVYSPMSGSIVKSPVTISGKARVFENIVNIKLEDADRREITRTTVYAKISDGMQFGEFSTSLYFTPPVPPSSGILKVSAVSEKDRSEEDMVVIPLRFR